MGTASAPAAPVKPAHGGRCPRCNNGILYAIAETDVGVYLACFNCDTRGTVPHDDSWVASVDPELSSPTGFTLTHEQLAAKGALDVEQTTQRVRTAARDRVAADDASAAAADEAEPHAQHDVVPPAGGEGANGG